MGFLGICWCSTLICLSASLLVHCLSPSDQIDLFSVQNHFLISFGEKKKVISSCAEPTETLTMPWQRCRFMNIRSTKAENLNSSKGYFYLIGVKRAGLSWLLQLQAACTSHQGFMWAPSHGLPSFTALWIIWYGSICSVLTFRFEVQSRKKCTRGSGRAPWTSTVLLVSWIFLQLFSPLLSRSSEGPGAPHPPSLYCLGFPYHDNYCLKQQKKSQHYKLLFI